MGRSSATAVTPQDRSDRLWYLPPVLLGLFPVLFFYANNLREVPFTRIPVLLLGGATLGCLTLLLLCALYRQRGTAALAASSLVMLFFLYGHVYEYLSGFLLLLSDGLASHVVLLALVLGAWLLAAWRLSRVRHALHLPLRFLLVFSSMLVLLSTVQIASFHLQRMATDTDPAAAPAGTAVPGELPDVLYIVLDEYAGTRAMAQLFDYDSTWLVNELRSRGFFVATETKARYRHTEAAMATILNMQPLETGADPFHLIRTSRVVRSFRSFGYRIIAAPFEEQALFEQHDQVIEYRSWRYDNSLIGLLQTTMLRPLAMALLRHRDYARYSQAKVLHVLESVANLEPSDQPRFVYAHINCPHTPFVFTADGGVTEPGAYFNFHDRDNYLQQHIFISTKVLELVDRLLTGHEQRPPVIIVQSDHGLRGGIPRNGRYPIEVGDLWQDILNAFYLPCGSDDPIPPSLAQADTFRLVFERCLHGMEPGNL